MACLDTSVLIDLGRRRNPLAARAQTCLRNLLARGETPSTTCFNLAELQVGAYRSPDPDLALRQIAGLVAGMSMLPFDETAGRIFAGLTARLQVLGRPAGDMDVLIAATALAAGQFVLVTRNPEHFASLPGLRVESY